MRGSAQQGAADTHLLSAVADQLGITLAQLAVSDKTNEIGAIGDLLSMLVLHAGYTNLAQAVRFFAAQPEQAMALLDLSTGE